MFRLLAEPAGASHFAFVFILEGFFLLIFVCVCPLLFIRPISLLHFLKRFPFYAPDEEIAVISTEVSISSVHSLTPARDSECVVASSVC